MSKINLSLLGSLYVEKDSEPLMRFDSVKVRALPRAWEEGQRMTLEQAMTLA